MSNKKLILTVVKEMTNEELLELELAVPLVYIERNGVYYQVPEWVRTDLEALNENKELLLELVGEEITRLKLHEYRCDEWGLEILNKRISRLEKIKEWLEK